ncbi:trypco2 family protein [Streptomyces sp. NPDC048384]|uniref:trypco2 family protein n=1 Tax=Streptomyces sp. NPDC048384 TaxID=3155487 RepID=UPI00341A9CDD
MSEIGLGEAIRVLRQELAEATGEGDGSWMRFQVSPVDLELQLVLTKDKNGKIGWNVLEAGASVNSATTQKVNLTLTPQWWNPSDGEYSTDWLVSGVVPASSAPHEGADHHGVPDGDSDPEDEK